MQLSPLYLEKIQAAEQRGELKGRQTGELTLTLKLIAPEAIRISN